MQSRVVASPPVKAASSRARNEALLPLISPSHRLFTIAPQLKIPWSKELYRALNVFSSLHQLSYNVMPTSRQVISLLDHLNLLDGRLEDGTLTLVLPKILRAMQYNAGNRLSHIITEQVDQDGCLVALWPRWTEEWLLPGWSGDTSRPKDADDRPRTPRPLVDEPRVCLQTLIKKVMLEVQTIRRIAIEFGQSPYDKKNDPVASDPVPRSRGTVATQALTSVVPQTPFEDTERTVNATSIVSTQTIGGPTSPVNESSSPKSQVPTVVKPDPGQQCSPVETAAGEGNMTPTPPPATFGGTEASSGFRWPEIEVDPAIIQRSIRPTAPVANVDSVTLSAVPRLTGSMLVTDDQNPTDSGPASRVSLEPISSSPSLLVVRSKSSHPSAAAPQALHVAAQVRSAEPIEISSTRIPAANSSSSLGEVSRPVVLKGGSRLVTSTHRSDVADILPHHLDPDAHVSAEAKPPSTSAINSSRDGRPSAAASIPTTSNVTDASTSRTRAESMPSTMRDTACPWMASVMEATTADIIGAPMEASNDGKFLTGAEISSAHGGRLSALGIDPGRTLLHVPASNADAEVDIDSPLVVTKGSGRGVTPSDQGASHAQISQPESRPMSQPRFPFFTGRRHHYTQSPQAAAPQLQPSVQHMSRHTQSSPVPRPSTQPPTQPSTQPSTQPPQHTPQLTQSSPTSPPRTAGSIRSATAARIADAQRKAELIHLDHGITAQRENAREERRQKQSRENLRPFYRRLSETRQLILQEKVRARYRRVRFEEAFDEALQGATTGQGSYGLDPVVSGVSSTVPGQDTRCRIAGTADVSARGPEPPVVSIAEDVRLKPAAAWPGPGPRSGSAPAPGSGSAPAPAPTFARNPPQQSHPACNATMASADRNEIPKESEGQADATNRARSYSRIVRSWLSNASPARLLQLWKRGGIADDDGASENIEEQQDDSWGSEDEDELARWKEHDRNSDLLGVVWK